MWLLLDAGNTRLKWRRADGQQLLDGGSVAIDAGAPEERVAALLSRVSQADRVIVSNVAGAVVGGVIEKLADEILGARAEFVVPTAEFRGLKNGYAKPATLGADRWAAMIGARELVKGPVCVVDCGTAITLDWIDAEGVHKGGMIIPGRRLMAECLVGGTQQIRLSQTPGVSAPIGLGTDTATCISAGTFACVAGMVERTVHKWSAGNEVACLVAGGDAPAFAAHLGVAHRLVPDLTFHGLLAFGRK